METKEHREKTYTLNSRQGLDDLKDNNVIFRVVMIVVASALFALNINTFVHTGGLLPGGATGLTLLLQEIFLRFFSVQIPYTVINLLINSVPVYIGFHFIGRRFTLLSCLVIVLSGVFTDLFPVTILTQDILLIAVFGGLINGAVVSLCLLMNATSGGTDFIAIYLSEKRGIDSFNISLFINVAIISVGGLLFGRDRALYSIIFQYVSITVIHTVYRKYQQATLFIVTMYPSEVSSIIYKISGHGATVIEGVGAYEHKERSIVYSIVSSAEARRVVSAVKERDPAAFVNIVKTERVIGRFYRRPED
ncbi:MAG: YitT family protein [Lachnospiraceae bacterium]|nr:YitT family protein [Lachnospiraceae bacterium]